MGRPGRFAAAVAHPPNRLARDLEPGRVIQALRDYIFAGVVEAPAPLLAYAVDGGYFVHIASPPF